MSKKSYKILILGGGAAGISLAARLKQSLPSDSIAIVEPSEHHYYQPLWTLIGAGLFKKEDSLKQESSLIPKGVTWIKEKVLLIDPESREVSLSGAHL